MPVRNARGPRHDRHELGRQPPEIVTRLLVRDVCQLAEPPDAGQAGDLRLRVGGGLTRKPARLVRLGLRHAGLEALVDEEPPHLLVRHLPDELLDVDAAIAQRPAFAVRLRDLGLDGDDALEPWPEFGRFAHRPVSARDAT